MGTNPNSIRDKRLDINKIFDLDNTTNNKTLNDIFEYYKEKLDINTFRNKFNNFLIENSHLILDKDYTAANTDYKIWNFRLLIAYGEYSSNGDTILANDYYDTGTDNIYKNSLSKFLTTISTSNGRLNSNNDNSGFISYIKGIEDYYPDPDSVGSGDPVIGSGDNEQHKIRNIKNTVFLVKNLIVINILKYYFLTELLMKSLLDTQLENSGSNTLGSNEGSSFGSSDLISQTFENDISSTFNTERDIGFNKSHRSWYGDANCIDNNLLESPKLQYHNGSSNNTFPTDEGNVQKFLYSINKIIYDMYVLSSMLKENAKLFRLEHTKNLHFGSGDLASQITNADLQIRIDNINNKIINFNQKNTDIQKNYEKNRNLFYIIVGSVILYIIFNMYIISVNNIDSLLIINLVIIIVIFIIKFLAIARKLYKSLVKDMNN